MEYTIRFGRTDPIAAAGKTAGMHFSSFNHITPLPGTDDVLLYNFFTCALMRLDPVQKRLFDFMSELSDDHPLKKSWRRAGFITELDEIGLLREITGACREAYESSENKTFSLTLHVTSLCNFDCPYCFQARRTGNMSDPVQEAVLRFAEKMLASGRFGTFSVGWFGGEPLLAADIIRRLGRRFRAMAEQYGLNYTSNIHTNAYLLDQRMVDMLEDVGCEFVLITIDGYGALHDKTRHLHGGGGTYDRILGNLSNIRTKMVLNIRSNLHRGNADSYDQLSKTIRAIAAATGNEMRCSPARVHVYDAGRRRGDVTEEITAEEYHRIEATTDLSERCGMFKPIHIPCHIAQPYDYVIDDEGYIYAHCNEYAVDQSRAFCNILELSGGSYDRIEALHADFIQQHSFPDDQPKCMGCARLPVCMGGCMVLREMHGAPECPENLLEPDAFILKQYRQWRSSQRNI